MGFDNLAKVSSPLGDDLRLLRMVGREELGRPFVYDLDLLSAKDDIDIAGLLGQPMTVHLELAGADDAVRFWNGVVSRFARVGTVGRYALYRATLRPWLWLLTRSADCRIFQRMTVPDVLKEVFRDHGLTDFDEALSESYREWEYLAQYRESAFNFVSRLMEQEGIYYFFKHEDGKHTLVLADSYGAHQATSGYEQIPYYPPHPGEQRARDHVDDLRISGQLQPAAYALDDYDFQMPKASLDARAAGEASRGFDIYDYPGEYAKVEEGERYARLRLEELHAQAEQVEAQGNVRGLGAGALFSLTDFPRTDLNREYLVTSASYQLEAEPYETEASAGAAPAFRCSLGAIVGKTPYRVPRTTPKPLISGPQTAVVVGPAGEEIAPDEHGRVKVQFHWDRRGAFDENSSCWVRVSQPWAGNGFGGVFIPRIGQEVVVEFLEGDPDRPIITGRVYNGDNKPPYKLPDNRTQSGIKTRSSRDGNPDNFNEIRFEDKKGEEQLYIQAEKNLDTLVKDAETHTVGSTRGKTIGSHETTQVGGNRTESVTGNETITITGSRTESVTGDETIAIAANRTETVAGNETITIAANRTETVAGEEAVSIGGSRTHTVAVAETVTVTAARMLNVGAAESTNVGGVRTVVVGGAQVTEIGAAHMLSVSGAQKIEVGGDRSSTVGKNDAVTVGKKLVFEAGDEITIKTGQASIVMKKNGDIVLKGKNVTLQGSGKITVKASGDVVIKGSKVTQN